MKILLDSCISKKTRDTLKEAGLDVIWSGDWEADPGDDSILSTAYEEKRILITLDKDFGEMVIVRRLPHSGIVRLVDLSVKQQAPFCLRVFEQYGELLQSGAIITVEPSRIRVRPPESPSE